MGLTLNKFHLPIASQCPKIAITEKQLIISQHFPTSSYFQDFPFRHGASSGRAAARVPPQHGGRAGGRRGRGRQGSGVAGAGETTNRGAEGSESHAGMLGEVMIVTVYVIYMSFLYHIYIYMGKL